MPALLGLMVALCATAAHAQRLPGVPYVEDVVGPGDRVRVTSDATTGEFVIADVRPGELSLLAAPTSSIDLPIVSLNTLLVRRGREISWLEGLGGGAAVGALVGGAFALQGSQPHYESLTGLSVTQNILVGVGLGTLVGLFISRTSDEVWQQVVLPHRPLERAPVRTASSEGDNLTVVGDLSSTDIVQMIVRNRTSEAMQAYAWWEGGARVSLGVVRPSSAVTFATARRSPGLVLVVSPIASPGPPTGPAPRSSLGVPPSPADPAPGSTTPTPEPRRAPTPSSSDYIDVRPGEQLEWLILESTAGVVREYVRRTPRPN
jgi:hypothetical protein